jgi:hypothetical protein
VVVTVRLNSKAALSNGQEIAPQVKRAVSDANGIYTFALWANEDLTPAGTSYLLQFQNGPFSSQMQMVVTNAPYPSGQSWLDVADLIVAIPPVAESFLRGPAGPGTPEVWSSVTTYGLGNFVIGSDQKVYVSKVDDNLDHDPTLSGSSSAWAPLW